MSDHERLLRLLKDNPSTWFATYEIAERLSIQANTAQRCINFNLRVEPIERRRREGGRVKEYRYEAHSAPVSQDRVEATASTPEPEVRTHAASGDDFCQCGTLCECKRSWWALNGLCTRCGVDRSEDVRVARMSNSGQNRANFRPRGKDWDSKAHKYVYNKKVG